LVGYAGKKTKMNSETKNCQNCKKDFVIEPEDFNFYEKIKVPAPTFCPDCRFQRRTAFYNVFKLYKRKCDLCLQEIVSIHSATTPYKVYCPKCWWSDKWDPYSYGREYDFSRSFFDQFNELCHQVPTASLEADYPTLENSQYTNQVGHLKNCYLVFFADFSEDCMHGFYLLKNKSLLDTSNAMLSELCFDSMNVFKCSRCVGTRGNITESLNCFFLRDCDNCQDCFASANLKNKKYHIFNKPYSKEEYFREIKKWDLGSYKTYKEVEKQAHEHWKKFPPRPTYDDFSVNCTGSYVFQSKNCQQCFEVTGAENSKYIFFSYLPPIKDTYDFTAWGNNVSLCYEVCSCGEGASELKFCRGCGLGGFDIEYSTFCWPHVSHLFGCASVKNGSYCILNKQYTKEEYEQLKAKIIEQMKENKEYGEFFPMSLSSFPYNDTMAQNFFPLTKEQAETKGLIWQDSEINTYQITRKFNDLPDHIKNASTEILNEVIECQQCKKGFKIIKPELDFLESMNLPLPRECPFCRIQNKFNRWVKQLTLCKRVCSQCGIEFETHYPKTEVENILCKSCWLKEVV
jgi:hypothetical protein